MYYIVKIITSLILIILISEISKRNTFVASIIASLPLVSIIAIIWLYFDTKDIYKIISLSQGIFWLVIPSLLFFIMLPILLKIEINFFISIIISIISTILAYYLMVLILKYFNIYF